MKLPFFGEANTFVKSIGHHLAILLSSLQFLLHIPHNSISYLIFRSVNAEMGGGKEM